MIEDVWRRERSGVERKEMLADQVNAYATARYQGAEFARFSKETAELKTKYMNVLLRLGIERRDLIFLLWGVEEGSAEERDWKKLIGRHPVELPETQSPFSNPCFTIGPRFDPISPVVALRSEKPLRFVLDMAVIRFGGEREVASGGAAGDSQSHLDEH